jgi:MFS family permease
LSCAEQSVLLQRRGERKSSVRQAFLLAAVAFVITMLGTTLPTPLYPLYEERFEIAPVWIPVIFAVYALAVIAGLLFFGRLSDEIGRRSVLYLGLALSAASAVVLLLSTSMAELIVGRIISGLSAGVFTGTATATLVELAPARRRAYAAKFAVAANMGGLGFGALLSGILATFAVLPLRLPYAVDLVLVAAAAGAMLVVPETVDRSARPLRLRVTRLLVPAHIRRTFLTAAVAGMCAFAVSGLFSAVVPSFLARALHRPQPILSGVVVFVLFAATAVGQMSVGRIRKRDVLAVACGTLITGTATLALAVLFKSLVCMFVAAAIEGTGQGLAIGSGLAAINEETEQQRGEVSSTYFVVLYAALALPVIGVGILASAWTLPGAALVFCVVVGLTVTITLFGLLAGGKN